MNSSRVIVTNMMRTVDAVLVMAVAAAFVASSSFGIGRTVVVGMGPVVKFTIFTKKKFKSNQIRIVLTFFPIDLAPSRISFGVKSI